MISIDKLAKLSKKIEIYPTITDHNTIEGALKLKKKLKQTIVGEEITTKEGEILGLFLTEKIDKKLPLNETIDKIHEQGGIVGVPHCFDKVRFRGALGKIPKKVDFVEVCNSRTIFQQFDKKARDFAILNNFPMSAGSDAHFLLEYGRAGVEIEEYSSPRDFLKKLKGGTIFCKRSFLHFHPLSIYSKLIRKTLRI